jgi:penicillin-binding protein 2
LNTVGISAAGRGRPLKDAFLESRLLQRRITLSMILVVLLAGLLLLRYTWLQVVSHDEFSTRSISNRVRLVPVAPNRGLIYDRRGRLIAENLPAYRLEIVQEKAGDLNAVLARLAQIIDLPPDAAEKFARDRRRYRNFDAVPVKFNLTEAEVARFAVDRHLYPGVDIVPYLSRHYPFGEMLTHVLGYVGRIDEDDLAGLDAGDYRATTHIGKVGIERQYETLLHGRSGMEKVESNAEGRVVRSLERQDPVHGDDLVLSLDMQVQQAAWDALGDRPGAVVAMDPNDGSVLALVSKPAFDPNLFVQGISSADYRAITHAPGRALFNRAIQGGYEPGSTFKPFVGLAGLELGVISRDKQILSSGNFYLAGLDRPFRDWLKGGHGWVNIYSALEQSVNTYFYTLALDIGIDRLHDYLAQFGFGAVSGLDLPGEIPGVLPSREWKRRQYNLPWYPGETVIGGIGQGFNVVTPVQLAVAVSTLCNGGTRYTPQLLYASKGAGNQPAMRRAAHAAMYVPVVDAENWNAVREGMRRVIHGVRGTARALLPLHGYEMAGKSGTAQVVEQDQEEDAQPAEAEVAQHLRNHALFIAFAPVQHPSIVVAAVVEHGGGGSRQAAPVAKAVIEAWLAQELPQ